MAFLQGYALLIGVDTYRNHPHLNVPPVAQDVESLALVLRDPEFCGYPNSHVISLSNATATRDKVLTAIDDLIGLDEDATVLFFYSGHGIMGENGNYYLTTFDTHIQGNRVVAGSGISEQELLTKLRTVKAKRLLLIINACHAGEISPILGSDNEPVTDTQLPEKTAAALLATGSGRVIITACREHQVSFVGDGTLTLFGQALIDGLQGKGDYITNRRGFISVFDLYTHLYDTLQLWVTHRVNKHLRQKYGNHQEPELTVLKGVGPFPIALYCGAALLGDFSAPEQPEIDTGLREIDESRSQRLLRQLLPSAYINTTITTYQSGGVNLGSGNQIGQIGDIVAGDKVGGDKVLGDKITTVGISGSTSTTIGHDVRAMVTTGSNTNALYLFQAIYAQIAARPEDASVEKSEIIAKVQQIEQEVNAGVQTSENKLERWLRDLAGMAPDIFKSMVACLNNPLAGPAETVKKISTEAKNE